MIIILSNSGDATADYVCSRMSQNDSIYIRLNTDTVTNNIKLNYREESFTLTIDGKSISPKEVSSVWYRRPEAIKLATDSFVDKETQAHTRGEWSAAIEGWLAHVSPKLWINHPKNIAYASSKPEQISRAGKLGLQTPRTLITQSIDEAIDFWRRNKGEIIAKPLSHGYIERKNPEDDTLIFTNKVTLNDLKARGKLLHLCPTLFQEEIDKECDIRVNFIDGKIIAVAIYADLSNEFQMIDIRRKNMKNVRYQVIDLPVEIEAKVSSLCSSYDLRFAAIDMALTTNHDWIFFEINPNGQWAWLDLEGVTDLASPLINSMHFTK